MSFRTNVAALAMTLGGLALASGAQAGPINAGFETGSYPPWVAFANNAVIGNLGPIAPPEGSFQSFSSTVNGGSPVALELFLGVTPGTLNALGNGTVDTGSAIKQTFAVAAGESVSFQWNFLTDEATPSNFNDFAFYVLDGVATELADTGSTFVPATGTTFNEQTGFRTLNLTFAAAGSHTLSFGVVDEQDSLIDSALLVDSSVVDSVVPEPGTLALLGIALAGLGFSRRKRAS